MRKLGEGNIQSRPFWHPLHTLEPFRECYAYKVKVADKLFCNGLSLPCSVGLQKESQQRVIEAIRKMRK